MPESNEKAWYKDGWSFMWVVGGLAFAVFLFFEWQKKPVDLWVAGRVATALFDDPSYKLEVWHQTEGALQNGKVTCCLVNKRLKDFQYEKYSFATWNPNRVNGRTFSIKLANYQPGDRLEISVRVTAKNAKETYRIYHWKNGWEN